MKKMLQSTLVLVCICAAISLLLAVTNAITAPIIAQNQSAAANEALLAVMPDGKDFEQVDLSAYTLPATVTEAYRESNGGYVITLTTTHRHHQLEGANPNLIVEDFTAVNLDTIRSL